MKNSKLHSLIGVLTKEDIKAAKRFLESPYHCTDPLLLALFNRIIQFYPKLESQQLASEALFSYLFPDEKEYNERRITNLRYKLSQHLNDFLAHEQLKAQPKTARRLLIGFLQQREAYEWAKREIENQIRALGNNSGPNGVDYHTEMAWLESQLYFKTGAHHFQLNHPQLFNAVKHTELAFGMTMLQYGFELETRKHLVGDQRSTYFFEHVKEVARGHFADENPIIGLYLKLLELKGKEVDMEQFNALKNELFGYFEKQNIGLEEVKAGWHLLVNYAIVKNNADCSRGWTNVLLGLYQDGLANNWLLENRTLDAAIFLNICLTASLVNEFDWAENFIKDYSPYLEEGKREKTKELCEANILYNRGKAYKRSEDIETALRTINHLSQQDTPFEFQLHTLELRALYDSDSSDQFVQKRMMGRAKDFKRYLNRQSGKVSGPLKERYLNFIDCYSELVRLRFSNEKNSKPEFLEKMDSYGRIAFECWLLEKADELGRYE